MIVTKLNNVTKQNSYIGQIAAASFNLVTQHKKITILFGVAFRD